MSTRAWLAVMLSFALGWMMSDVSEQLQMLLYDLLYWIDTGTWGGAAC